VFTAEQSRIENRRQAIHPDWHAPSCPQRTIGLALSGGGIRSATFSLGMLQSLAKRRLLQRIDYLSTVSGGGYIGCFLGSLFLPDALRRNRRLPNAEQFRRECRSAYRALRHSAVAEAPSSDSAGVKSALIQGSATLSRAGKQRRATNHWDPSQPFEWLRINGRYLAPRGVGDLLYVAGLHIRNWAGLHWVVGIVIVAGLVSFATARGWLLQHSESWRAIEVFFLPRPGALIYWSPGWALVGALGLLTLLPPALAYWVVHGKVDQKSSLSWLPLWHEGAIVFLISLGLSWAYSIFTILADRPRGLPPFFWVVAGYAVILVIAICTFFVGYWMERGAYPGNLDLKSLRTRFTRWLRWTFQIFVCSAGLALLGTIGQTAYAFARPGPSARTSATLAAVLGAIVAGARRLFAWLGSDGKAAHPRLPLTAAAAAGALALLLLTGGVWSTLVQAALWRGGPPPTAPDSVVAGQRRTWSHARQIYVSTWGTDSVPIPLDTTAGSAGIEGKTVGIDMGWMYVLFGGVIFLLITTGTFLNFLNMSSLHQFYAARLTRAYLGATNRDRFQGDRVLAVTSPLGSDTIPLSAYYHPHLAAPVHLVNVTLNQTRPSEGQLVQRDRKGMSMVVGPEYTIVNSAVFRRDDANAVLTPINTEARKLCGGVTRPFRSEELDLGDWCAISGAAFSTGLGLKTSVSLSLLAGLANVRLGYWWNFNSERFRSGLFATYRYLWDELMADFQGPWKRFWFLTDGGHFDNTGVYELVRRRVGIILLCDNGCDPGYRFDDLGNLARKIRTDFGAELTPITPADPLGERFGRSADFAKGKTRAGKCALAYWIVYPRSPGAPHQDRSLLVVLKPNMIPEAPLDVVEYRSEHDAFPHQSTLNQFFDDAQWESYRKLGEATADAALDSASLRFNGWYEMLPEPAG
jgi:Patatin-like phospholipase